MKRNLLKYSALALAIAALASCAREQLLPIDPQQGNDGPVPISLGGSIDQQNTTRAGESGFCDGDRIATFIVDWVDGAPGELLLSGNRADNLYYSYEEASNRWIPSYDVYYKDKTTPVDIYGYYPAAKPESIDKYAFEVQKNQRAEATSSSLAAYEQSDFLWAKAEGKTAADKIVYLSFKHRMAGVRVTLLEGEGFAEGEWAAADKDVLVQSTRRTSTINLATGEVSATGEVPESGIIPVEYGDDYRAVVVPQTVPAGSKLVTATVAGQAYDLVKSEDMVYVSGKMHNFTLTVNKRAAGSYEFVLSSESITVWENDRTSHDGIAREYVVINVETPGTLDACIAAKGLEISKVRNLKLTGTINSRDFAVMKYKMNLLNAINLKEAIIVASEGGSFGKEQYYYSSRDYCIPAEAFMHKNSLTTVILPDKLKEIDGFAFYSCQNLTGSIIIPEGVVALNGSTFEQCKSINGILSLPSTLKYLGSPESPYGRDFWNCKFVCQLVLPEGLEFIGERTFNDCDGLYGELRFPENVSFIGEAAFAGCKDLKGSLTIPQKVALIEKEAFCNCGFNGTLILHDGIKSIGPGAFSNTPFKGELNLPKSLEVINDDSFSYCDFSGTLSLPNSILQIGNKAFCGNWRLMGVVEMPDELLSIGESAFQDCRMLEGVIFKEKFETIRRHAFENCFGIGRIVCKGTIPPYIQDGCFNGVPKDNFTLEVPEGYEAQYQAATGWREFKRIAAYRNLVIRPMVATAINTSVTRDLVLTADDNWSVKSQPEWVTLSQTSGKGKTSLQLTFAQKPQDGLTRSGEVVFQLDGKDYETRLAVSQYDYEYAEDEIITLQSASKGNGVNIVILGDGFNAKDISEGKLMNAMEKTYEHFFSIQPYKYYKDYFNVYTAVPVSPESGIGTVNTLVQTRFNTAANGGVTRNGEDDYYEVMQYACKAPTVNNDNINRSLIIMIPNTEDYGGVTYMWSDGTAIAYCPMSDYGYPLDFRGVIQHEAGGHGFGKLGDEYIYHNEFIQACLCTCCPHAFELQLYQSIGWFQNLSLTGKMGDVPWRDFIFHEKYSEFVDIFEGGYMHTRGVYRSEQNSCMNNDIPYFSTISRYEIYKRIMEYAGEAWSLEDFIEHDVIEAVSTSSTKAENNYSLSSKSAAQNSHEPVFMGERPQLN